MEDFDMKHLIEQQARTMSTIGIVPLMETFVLRNGHLGKPAPRPAGHAKMKDKECFHNATHYLMEHGERGWRYVEGYASRPGLGILVHHAWVEDAEGNVHDLTWRLPQTCHYFGVSFDPLVLHKQLSEQEYYGLLAGPVAYNHEFMFEQDKELKGIIETAVEAAKAIRAALDKGAA